MAQESLRSDQFTVWVREKKIGFLRERALLWRVKHAKRMGEDPKRQIATAGHLVVVKRKDALGTLGPAILEVLFNENPLDELVTALREASTEMVREFLSDLRYLLVSESDAQISDITFFLSNASLLTAFSYRSQQKGISDDDFEALFPALSDAQIRLIDLNGSCPTKEIQLIVKNLNVRLVRFHRYPGVNVETFENTKLLNSAVEFIVAQGLHPSIENSGMRFLRHLKNVFPAIKQIFWDWSMMMPTLTCIDAEVMACLNELLNLYKEMEMNLLAILFFMSSEGSEELMEVIWKHLKTFHLPNAKMRKVMRDDKPYYCPPYMFFIAGTSEKISRLEKIVCTDRIVEPDLRHFLYVQNRSINIYKNDNIYEFMGFDYERDD
ncbi:Uncharacterized protein BM_BM11292 [Brugia malayi]|uniref:Bm9449 n=1 Tax=Brugia malayi TaxID=6279 RepID=A0A1P6BIG9_BRUMA|nr:Uncharacterized protein BM_BM11292 [Brugia malayi]CTP81008.1 Bm9449 [Brugia malayi]VIO97245.1 Uncharacterized protein BM_BM11292 [Brugia malayi]